MTHKEQMDNLDCYQDENNKVVDKHVFPRGRKFRQAGETRTVIGVLIYQSLKDGEHVRYGFSLVIKEPDGEVAQAGTLDYGSHDDRPADQEITTETALQEALIVIKIAQRGL